jgi:hypothetical protein
MRKFFKDVVLGDILISKQIIDGKNLFGVVEAIEHMPKQTVLIRSFREGYTYVIHASSIGHTWEIVT